jgi:drug/metabolite transporter (DMT)-like permease
MRTPVQSIKSLLPITTGQTFRASAQTKGVVLLGLAILIWGINWPVMKTGLSHIGPYWFSATRFALGGLCLFVLQIVTGKLRLPTKRDLPLVLSVGLIQMLTFTLLGSIAMTEIPAGRSAVLAYTTPLWVTPITILFFREKLSRNQAIGIGLGVLGVVVLFNPLTLDWSNTVQLKANMMLLAGSFCWALCIIHLRYYKADSSAYTLAPWQMLVATVPLVIFSYIVEGPYNGDGSSKFWETILYVGPVATAFCFCAVNAASMWLSSTNMATAMLGVPVIGLLSAVIFLGETLTLPLSFGVMAILAGIVFVSKKTHKPS